MKISDLDLSRSDKQYLYAQLRKHFKGGGEFDRKIFSSFLVHKAENEVNINFQTRGRLLHLASIVLTGKDIKKERIKEKLKGNTAREKIEQYWIDKGMK